MSRSIPSFSVDLIKILDAQIPERVPDISMPNREIWFYAGKRDLVRSLLAKLKEDEEEEME